MKPSLGRPGLAGLFKTIYFVGLVVEIAIRVPFDRQRRRQHIVVDRVNAQEQTLFGLLSLSMIGLPLAYIATRWLDRANYRLTPRAQAATGGAGTLVLAAALWLFRRAHVDLGSNWSPSLQLREEHTLVTGGVYSSIRHPMYASQVLWGIAQALLLQNWIAGWASLVVAVLFYALRVPREEQLMREQFGAEYDVYMQRSGRLLPRIGRPRG